MGDLAQYASVLTAHPAVHRALATTIRHNGRDVAIGVAEYSEYVCGAELREHVWQRLGADCGLAGVLPVDTLPLAGDTLDADRVVSAVAAGACTVYESPADSVEERLAAIWSRALKLNRIGVHDDFLDLGGDSVVAIEILFEIEKEFGHALDVFDFMEACNVRRLAAILRDRQA
jgi:acyl carrier protein